MLKESKDSRIRNIPVYVDSPLAVNATKIFQKYLSYFDEDAQKLIAGGDNPFDFPNLILTQTADESKAINASTESCIIISASGMCEAGRIKHHLKHNLWRKESSVVFVGYQAQNTLGRRIKDGEKTVKIFGEEIGVKCSVHSIEGFSGHADQKGLMDWLGSFGKKPKKVFLVHGEEDSLKTLSRLIDTQLGIPNEVAVLGQSIELTAAAATKTAVERAKVNKEAVLRTLNILKSEVAKTLEKTEVQLSEDEYVKIDAIMYMLEKLQYNITELKKELG
jgi:metallo-beta-lactamase family protein